MKDHAAPVTTAPGAAPLEPCPAHGKGAGVVKGTADVRGWIGGKVHHGTDKRDSGLHFDVEISKKIWQNNTVYSFLKVTSEDTHGPHPLGVNSVTLAHATAPRR
jgi:hypothetical protein